MRKVGGLVRVMADQFEIGLAVAQNHDFAADRYKGNKGVRPEAALAGDCDPGGAVLFNAASIFARAASSWLPVRSISRLNVPNRSVSKPLGNMI